MSDALPSTTWSQISLLNFMARYRDPLVSYAKALLRSLGAQDSPELVVATFMDSQVAAAEEGRATFQRYDPEEGRFRTYLRTSLRNHVYDTLRQRGRVLPVPDDDEGGRQKAPPVDEDPLEFFRMYGPEMLRDLEPTIRQLIANAPGVPPERKRLLGRLVTMLLRRGPISAREASREFEISRHSAGALFDPRSGVFSFFRRAFLLELERLAPPLARSLASPEATADELIEAWRFYLAHWVTFHEAPDEDDA